MQSEDCSVVLVDDDRSVRVALARLFRSAGMVFIAFASAEEFLESDSFNSAGCLIADVRMPRMQGLELQQICSKKRPTLPVIIISAFNDDDAEDRAIQCGAKAYLHKPFDPSALLHLAREALGKETGSQNS
jgi:FixJ family two-component response regulator